ncbi:ABC transporter permease [Frankia sp. CNm7]|uniref:ABC transporter permease n=1 Tax=Frankia nepalensis TaxID=1836974 RepID=A0A937RQM8_9ACTN|nr:ABC transporter permease [Frankia nepalensis]MBL7496463.1 ABC transporter permease [Frankia nepalensis]MBL7510800.1 ABC transporter permease [Frankia nepalensis]MBL7521703.1 ABC transporter permease [Frankia nepalensis]MBL7631599.1 ABC transporter permease [Frankia nepalensis]
MDQFLQYTILGLVLGGIYGIAASGLVLTCTTSGVFNFGHGSIAMLSAFLYWQVRFDWNWPTPVALVAVLGVFAPAFGALLHITIMRGLRETTEITRITVTVALTVGALALANWIWDPTVPRRFDYFFGGTNQVKIFGSRITYHELLALAAAVLIAVGLRFFFYRTRTGVGMRAVVDDPPLLQLTGGRPERLATLSWALGAMLAALAGILITPILGGALDPNALTLLVIDAFAAAVFGRLRSVPLTFLGAVVLGLANNYVLAYFPSERWTWTSNFRISLPMILLFVVLLVLPQDRLRGGTITRARERFRVPTMRSAVVWAVILVVGMFLLREIMAPAVVNTMVIGMTFAVIALSLVPLTGYAGEINLAPVSFGAIGTIIAYHYGVTGSGVDTRMTVWGLLLAAAVCAVVGALVALPALRLRGLYLALATMAFGVFVSTMVVADTVPRVLPLLHVEFSIFPNGTLNVPRPRLGPIDLADGGTFLMVITVLFAVLGVLMVALRRSGYGHRLVALKDSPAACATLGQNPVRLKLSVFMLSAAIAGLGGALMSAAMVSVNPDRFVIFVSLGLVMTVVVAGIGYVSGAFAGGLLAGVGFVALQNMFDKVGTDHASLSSLFSFLSQFSTVLPALIGIGLARNPTGFVDDIIRAFEVFRRARVMLAAGLALQAAIYLLAYTDTFSNWWFVALTVLLWGIWPRITPLVSDRLAPAVRARRAGAGALPAGPADGPAEVPLELVGVDVPLTDEHRRVLDRALGLPETAALPGDLAAVPGRVTPSAGIPPAGTLVPAP